MLRAHGAGGAAGGPGGEAAQPSSDLEVNQVPGAGPSFGQVDQNTVFTTNNQSRQVRVISKRQMKSIHYSYQPVTRAGMISSGATGTASIAQLNNEQAQYFK